MSKKAEPKHYRPVGWDWKGEPIVKWIRIGNEKYPLTAIQWERRQSRLAKGEGTC